MLYQFAMCVVVLCCCVRSDAQELPCFDEFRQLYEYDDGGWTWENATKPPCGKTPIPGDPGGRHVMGGRLEVRKSGDDVYFHEHVFGWALVADESRGVCTGVRETHKETTKVVRDGVYYELVEDDGKPPRRKQKPGGRINIPNNVTIPRDLSRPPFEDLGVATIAGQKCQRFRTTLGREQITTHCVARLAPGCPSARYLFVLEKSAVLPSNLKYEGRTTLLRTGQKGQVLEPGAIAPP